MKRLFDIVVSVVFLVIFSPIYVLIGLAIMLDSNGGPIYIQKRIGKDKVPFGLFKFRTMRIGSDKKGLLTIGDEDNRVTSVGYFLRKYKLDELPQLVNILRGEMSVVGPRPEVEKYLFVFKGYEQTIFSVRPGLTDYASIKYRDENELLAQSEKPEETYIEEILPEKIRLGVKYVESRSFWVDLRIIFKTFVIILFPEKQSN